MRDISLKLLDFADFVELKGFDYLLAELEEEGKMFAVVGCGEISDDTLTRELPNR